MAKRKKKRQRTRWIWWSVGSPGNATRIGIIYNKAKGNPYDIIRLQSISTAKDSDPLDLHMRIDEAMTWAAGLSKTLCYVLLAMPKFALEDYYKDLFQPEKWYWWKKKDRRKK